MKFPKIFGWFLLIIGLLIIIWTLYSSYNVFTGKTLPSGVFKMEAEGKPFSQKQEKAQSLETQMEKMMGEQLKELIPGGALPKILNLIVFSMLAGIFIFGGAQISNLGIKLIISKS